MRFTIDRLSATYFCLTLAFSFSLFVVSFIGRNRDDIAIHQALRAINIFILAIGQMLILPDLSLFTVLCIAESFYLLVLICGDFVKSKQLSQNRYTLASFGLSAVFLWVISNVTIAERVYSLSTSRFTIIAILITLLSIIVGLARHWHKNFLFALTCNALALFSLMYIQGLNAFLLATIFKSIYYITFIRFVWQRVERYYLIEYAKAKESQLKIYQNISDKNKALAKEIARENDDLAKATRIDAATGALNKKGLYEKLESLIDDEMINTFSIIVFDIDNFKQINDNFGHLTGDKCLVQLVKYSKSAIRSSDFLGRFGGDEFIIILPHANRKIATELSERLRKKIETSTEPKFTISLGLASFPSDGKDKQKLIEVADAGLYKAKKQGRNQSAYAPSEQ